MVDSAPALWLTLPSACTPSTGRPVAGSYAGWPEALAPKYQAATMPASRRMPAEPVTSAVASSDCSRESTP